MRSHNQLKHRWTLERADNKIDQESSAQPVRQKLLQNIEITLDECERHNCLQSFYAKLFIRMRLIQHHLFLLSQLQ